LQCVAVCCSVWQCVLHVNLRRDIAVAVIIVVWCRALQCVAVCCSVLQCVAVYCRLLQCVAVYIAHEPQTRYCRCSHHCCTVQSVAVCCSVLQTVAVCGSVCCTRTSDEILPLESSIPGRPVDSCGCRMRHRARHMTKSTVRKSSRAPNSVYRFLYVCVYTYTHTRMHVRKCVHV